MNSRRGWIIGAAVLSFALALAAVGVALGWVSNPIHPGVPAHHGEAYGKALISGQLLIGHDPHHSEPLGTGSVALANIYQVGPVSPIAEVWADGGFSTYVEPGTYTIFGVSPEFHNGVKACDPYDVPNGTISVQAGDRIGVALLCR